MHPCSTRKRAFRPQKLASSLWEQPGSLRRARNAIPKSFVFSTRGISITFPIGNDQAMHLYSLSIGKSVLRGDSLHVGHFRLKALQNTCGVEGVTGNYHGHKQPVANSQRQARGTPHSCGRRLLCCSRQPVPHITRYPPPACRRSRLPIRESSADRRRLPGCSRNSSRQWLIMLDRHDVEMQTKMKSITEQ